MTHIPSDVPRLNARRPRSQPSFDGLPLRSLTAPGIVPEPFVDPSGARTADALLRITRGAGQLSAQLGAMHRARSAEEERALRGEAILSAGQAVPQVLGSIDRGEVAIGEDQDSDEAALALLDQFLPETASEAYRDAYAKVFLPQVVRGIESAKTMAVEKARADLAVGLRASIVSATPHDLDSAIRESASALGSDPSSPAFLENMVAPALDAAVDRLDRTQFDAVAARLEDVMPGFVADRRRQFEAAAQRQANAEVGQRVDEFQSRVAERLLAGDVEGAARVVNDADVPATVKLAEATRIASAAEAQEKQRVTEFETAAAGITDPQVFGDFLDRGRAIGLVDDDRAATLTRRFQSATTDRLLATMQANPAAREMVMAQAQAGIELFASDPASPSAITPSQFRSLREEAGRVEQADISQQRVIQRLSGDTGVLITPNDDKAARALVEQAGLIDARQRITNPADLAAVTLELGIHPRGVDEIVYAGLGSDQPEQILEAAQYVRGVSGEPSLFQDLVDGADDSGKIALRVAKDNQSLIGADDGEFVRRIRAAVQAVTESEATLAGLDADLRARKIDVGVRVNDLARKALRRTPQGRDTILGNGIFFMDPAADPGTIGLQNTLDEQWRRHYLLANATMTAGQAAKAADAQVEEFIEANVDFVRWRDAVRPVLIRSTDASRRLPRGLRWNRQFEQEARKDLREAGFKPSDAVSMAPFTDVADPKMMGWAYIDEAGLPIRDADGSMLIFRPDEKLQRVSDEELRRRARAFSTRNDHALSAANTAGSLSRSGDAIPDYVSLNRRLTEAVFPRGLATALPEGGEAVP